MTVPTTNSDETLGTFGAVLRQNAPCACMRTNRFCYEQGCKQGTLGSRYSVERRERDHLQRLLLRDRPICRWMRPERIEEMRLELELHSGVTWWVFKWVPEGTV